MYLTTLPPEHAVGHILRHNIADADGRKALAKGRRLRAEDALRLRELGVRAVPVAVLEPGDAHEDVAARRLAAAVCGAGIRASAPVGGRVNLLAEADGVVNVDVSALLHINELDGLTVATLPAHALVRARKRLATIKIIPFAVPETTIAHAEELGRTDGTVLAVQPLRTLDVGVIIVGTPAAQDRLQRTLAPPITARVEELGSTVSALHYIESDEAVLAATIGALQQRGTQLLIIAGETSIMDRDDVTPRGIRRAGGHIEHYGAPVEPGNLLLLAYLDNGALPVLGAPGCVRSRDTNIVDLLLPRLLAGEHIVKRDIVALGHGGLLG